MQRTVYRLVYIISAHGRVHTSAYVYHAQEPHGKQVMVDKSSLVSEEDQ